MTKASLINAADTIGQMIKAARRDLARGREINLVGIEHVMAGIHRRVAENREPARGEERAHLAQRLGDLMSELDALEGDLTQRYQIAIGD